MHQAIAVILEKIRHYPDVRWEQEENSITIFPTHENGFPVSFFAHSETRFTVYMAVWHEEFDQMEEALNCFSFGLSTQCRLKVTERSGKPYKWTVESKHEGKWQEERVTGLFNFAFWQKPTERFLQNDLIQLDD